MVLVGLIAAASGRPAAGAPGTTDLLGGGTSARERVIAGGTAAADPAAALGSNPALLAGAAGLTVRAHLAPLPEGGSLDALGVVVPLGPGTLGAGLVRLGAGDIATFDAEGIATGRAAYGDVEVGCGYALAVPWPLLGGERPPAAGPSGPADRFAPALRLGLAGRFRRQSFASQSGAGFGLDLGLALQPRPGLVLGARIRNLVAPSLTVAMEAERLPRALALGGAWAGSLAGRPLLLTGDSQIGSGEAPLAFGVETPFAGVLAARAGLRGSDLRLGLGLSAGFLALDYGLESHDLGLVHMLTLTARLGQGAAEVEARARAAEEAERARLARAAAEAAVAAKVEELRATARAASDRAAARGAWLAVRAHRPDDLEAIAALTELEAQETAASRDSLVARERETAAAVERLAREARQREAERDLAGAAAFWGQILVLAPAHPEALSGLEQVRARFEAAADSLAVVRRDLGARDADLAAQAAELARLGLLLRALDALEAGETARARALSDSLSAASPGDPAVAALRARLTPGESSALLQPELRELARNLYIEGMRRFNAGDYDEAIQAWEELLQLDPGNQAVRLNLDEARARRGAAR